MKNALHSCESVEWGTPFDVLERVRRVIGTIDFDPATSDFFQSRVRPTYYFDKQSDGLTSKWPICEGVFLNPPGGKVGNKSMTTLFWNKLLENRDKFAHAIFLAFSIEAAQTTQSVSPEGTVAKGILAFPFCVPRKRLRFVDRNGDNRKAPTHSSVIVYVPGRTNRSFQFMEVFAEMGVVRGQP